MLRRGFRLIGRSFRAHPVPHAIAIVGAVSFAVSVVALSRAIAWVTDEVVTPALVGDGADDERVVIGFGVIMVIAVVRGAGAIVRRYYLSMAESKTKGTWRSQIYDQYLRLPIEFHRQTPTGELIAHADNDLVVAGMVLRPLAFAVATVVLAVLAVISLSLLHWSFGLVALVVLPLLFIVNRVYSAKVSGPVAEVQQSVADVTSVAHESFDGVMVVKTLGRIDAEIDRMRIESDDLRTKRLRVGRLRAVFEPLIDLIPNIGILALLLLGARLVDSGDISVGDLVGAMSLFSVLGLPIRIIGFFLQSMPSSVVALDRIDRVLAITPPDGAAPGALPDGPLELHFDNVSFAHDDHVVLSGVDLRVGPGETVALVGATGSGKTTMLELATGLIRPQRGTVTVGALDAAELATHDRASRLGMVFQETFLFAQSIGENITMGDPSISGADAVDAARASQAHDFVTDTPEGYDTIVGERGVTLSGGQRQRVALARALVRDPSLVLLDDATSAVDPSIEAAILRGLGDRSMTVLMVAHRLSTIALADRVAYLEGGSIVAAGTHEELLDIDGYRTLVQAYEDAR